MVVASTDFSRALSNPLQAIQDLYEKEGDKSNFTSLVAQHFETIFDSNESKAKIAPLTRQTLANRSKYAGQLVRWRCMIQDTSMGSELMPRRHKDTRGVYQSSLFGASSLRSDQEELVEEICVNPSELSSVNTLYAVSLPGQSRWSQIAVETLDLSDEISLEAKLDSTHLKESKADTIGISSKLPTGQEMGVLLRVYDEDFAESVRVAQVVDIIGILDECTVPSAEWAMPEEGEAASDATLLPAIHIISMQKASPSPTSDSDVPIEEGLRQALLVKLTQTLQGDRLAAEWLLLSLIARLHTRTSTHTLGPLSLNISSCSSSQATQLYQILSDILPLVVNQSLELTHLNDAHTHFVPRSKGDESGLSAGSLQLVDGTLLIIDENSMQEGQLKENGIENIRTLSNLLTTRKLTYAFPYSNLEMDADINCVIFSQGKSFLPFDVQVPLQPQSPSKEATDGAMTGKKGTSFASKEYREYLRIMQSRSSEAKYFTIPTDISDRIQNDFVESRNVKKSSIGTPEDLSRTLQVARLLCISKGGKELSWQDWSDAKELDAARMARLSSS